MGKLFTDLVSKDGPKQRPTPAAPPLPAETGERLAEEVPGDRRGAAASVGPSTDAHDAPLPPLASPPTPSASPTDEAMTSWRRDVTTSRLSEADRVRILRSVGETNTTIRLVDEELDWLRLATLELRKSLDTRISQNDVMRTAIDYIRDLYAADRDANPLTNMLRKLKK